MKKLLTIILIVVLILCGIKFLTSCGNVYNGVEYDYDGITELKDAVDDSTNLTGKKIFLKEYVIMQNPLFSDQTYIELGSSTHMSIVNNDFECIASGVCSVPILIEIVQDISLLGNRSIIAKVIG